MIYIEQDSPNPFITRFWDRRTSTTSFFLWRVVNEFTKDVTFFALSDTSGYPGHYNQFNLVHTSNSSNVNGINTPVFLTSGHNRYQVFETTELSLDESFIIGSKPIEEGILFVEIIRGVNTPGSNINNIYY